LQVSYQQSHNKFYKGFNYHLIIMRLSKFSCLSAVYVMDFTIVKNDDTNLR
jgi:hypothetical protein